MFHRVYILHIMSVQNFMCHIFTISHTHTYCIYMLRDGYTPKLTVCICSSFFWGVYFHTGQFSIALHNIHLQFLLSASEVKLFNHLHLKNNTFITNKIQTSSLLFQTSSNFNVQASNIIFIAIKGY